MYFVCGGEREGEVSWGPFTLSPRQRSPDPGRRTASPHRLIKNLSSARDERSFRGTTLIVASTNQLSRTKLIGGPEGARTPDLIHAMDALSQLRYRPMLFLGNE